MGVWKRVKSTAGIFLNCLFNLLRQSLSLSLGSVIPPITIINNAIFCVLLLKQRSQVHTKASSFFPGCSGVELSPPPRECKAVRERDTALGSSPLLSVCCRALLPLPSTHSLATFLQLNSGSSSDFKVNGNLSCSSSPWNPSVVFDVHVLR